MSYTTSAAVQEAMLAGYSGPRRSKMTDVSVPQSGTKTARRCKFCGLPTRADVVTTYRKGKTFKTTFFRCPNARTTRSNMPGRSFAKPKCEVEKQEEEITETMPPIEKKEKKAPQPASWCKKPQRLPHSTNHFQKFGSIPNPSTVPSTVLLPTWPK